SDNNRIHGIPGSLDVDSSRAHAIQLTGGLSTALALEPAAGALGTLGRNTLRGDRLMSWNAAIHKDISVTEKVTAQLRVETFNLFNTTNFNAAAIGNVLSVERNAQTGEATVFNPNFGRNAEAYSPRSIQLALRFVF